MQKIEKKQHRLVLRQVYSKSYHTEVIIHIDNIVYQGKIKELDDDSDTITIDRGKEISVLPLSDIDELYIVYPQSKNSSTTIQ